MGSLKSIANLRGLQSINHIYLKPYIQGFFETGQGNAQKISSTSYNQCQSPPPEQAAASSSANESNNSTKKEIVEITDYLTKTIVPNMYEKKSDFDYTYKGFYQTPEYYYHHKYSFYDALAFVEKYKSERIKINENIDDQVSSTVALDAAKDIKDEIKNVLP
ncbi:uncharacterized protein LOC123293649 [Chrysoperla carnea]|uniref:uncharacterized protein LOC123293649 n=1 Tax=Chrysoperla carnea TaxID=189513 RepID=UPI001D06A32A|nr:uncharacterized protein LOC123293649 [Chrysoperla carnea]